MKKVLIVDDEAFIIKLLTRILTNYVKDVTLFTAEDGEEAISVLANESIDLVITDLQMPVMDGFELIAYIMQNFHSLPIIVLTGYNEDKLGDRLRQSSSLTLVQKHNLDFRAFSEKVTKALMPVTKGHIEGITLFSFLQLLNLDKKTCTLTIKASGRKGFLYFSEGQLISAVCEGIESIYSAYEILVWDDTKIEIDNICRKKKNVINAPLDEVLMDAFKIKDEANREKGIFPEESTEMSGAIVLEDGFVEEANEDFSVERTYTSEQAVKELTSLLGVISCAIIDWKQEKSLIYEQVVEEGPAPINVSAIKNIFTSLGSIKELESLLITLHKFYYLIYPLTDEQDLVFYLILDREKVDLAQIRLKLNLITRNVSI